DRRGPGRRILTNRSIPAGAPDQGLSRAAASAPAAASPDRRHRRIFDARLDARSRPRRFGKSALA
ncbi:MAG: hypothetical protein ACKODK_22540, partial [Opitutaceae bacterium]